jgi:hypothetical protein
MTTSTIIAAISGTRLRVGYLATSVEPGGKHAWPQSQSQFLGLADFCMNNSTGVSDVECRHR